LKAGYNYYGSEIMYSGVSGLKLEADIFIGVVYYQRLRHMVSDKSQARATGPYDTLTHQPVKGRKHHGGIRFGEMERDSLLAHGTAYSLHDRLLLCSDYSEGYVCSHCGSILSFMTKKPLMRDSESVAAVGENIPTKFDDNYYFSEQSYCKVCDSRETVKVSLPYVLRYLTNELAAMNIRLTFKHE